MTIEIHETTHVFKIWHVELLPNIGNMMAIVLRDPPEGWRAIYRFRWYRDDKIFHSDDKRSWYKIDPQEGGPGDRDKLIEMFELMMVLHTKHWRTNIHRVHVDAVGPKALDVMMKQPWMHGRKAD